MAARDPVERRELFQFADAHFAELYREAAHVDLSRKRGLLRRLQKGERVDLPPIDFVTVE